MIYTLDDITLGRFIDVYLGDFSKASDGEASEEELKEAAVKMVQEYLEITGGASVQAMLCRRNEVLKMNMRSTCMGVCRMLALEGRLKEACEVLKSMGYSVKEDKNLILRKVETVLSTDAYRMKKMEQAEEGHKEMPTRDTFTKERVMVMAQMKMHIDENVFKAKEYAYLVRRVMDEVEGLKKQIKKHGNDKRGG